MCAQGGSLVTGQTDPEDAASILGDLPLSAWARRFSGGSAFAQGHVVAAVSWHDVRVDPGATWLRVDFAGGARPRVERAVVTGMLFDGGRQRAGRELEITDDGWTIDGFKVAGGAPGALLEVLVGALHDVSVRARAWPDADLRVQFANGVGVVLPSGRTVEARAAAVGGPSALRLAGPLRISVEGEGVRMTLGKTRWVSAVAGLRIAEAQLHPDGSVALRGGGAPGLNRAVRTGLKSASIALSQLVRRSPRFAAVRAFLPRV